MAALVEDWRRRAAAPVEDREPADIEGACSPSHGPAAERPTPGLGEPESTCVNMTWEAKARARHRLESSLSGSRDSDYGDGVSPVVDGSGPM